MARQTPTRLARKRRTCRRLAVPTASGTRYGSAVMQGQSPIADHPSPSSDHDVAAQEAIGVAEQDRLTALRAAAMRLWVVLGDEPRIAQGVDREVDRGIDVAGLQRAARIEVLRPGATHAIGHQLQLDGVDLLPAIRPVPRSNPLQTHG